jgi:ribosomal-protein-alanine N-acetyltransferase
MVQLNLDPYPVIHTERLTLRKLKEADADDIFALRSDEKVLQHTGIPKPATVDDAAAYIQKILNLEHNSEAVQWGITLNSDNKIIGTICFWNVVKENHHAEIGYILRSDFHNKGIMQEAMEPVIDYGFDTMKLHTIEAQISPENTASIKLVERSGFVQTDYFKEKYEKDGQFVDSMIFGLKNTK